MTNNPVLLIVYNRPDLTEKILDQIIRAQPRKIYIAGDGFKTNADKEIIEKTRTITIEMTKGMNVQFLWRDKNLGCKKGVIGAINWFFENEESGIILEDDCLPDPSFFRFCDEVLEKYKEDPRIMHIAGSNLKIQGGNPKEAFYFSRLPNIWGWASWRRAWNLYDSEMKRFDEFKSDNYLKDIIKDPILKKRYVRLFEKIYAGVDTWDFQWTYSNIMNKGLSIIPNKNLIKNIGFGNKATHSIDPANPLANLELEKLVDFNFPVEILIDKEAETKFLQITNKMPPLNLRVKNKLKKLSHLILKAR